MIAIPRSSVASEITAWSIVDEPVVERQTILLALLDGRRESLVDMSVDMAAKRFKVALPKCFEDHPVGRLRAFQEAGDIESRVGGKDRANTRSRSRHIGHVAGVDRGRLTDRPAG